MKTAFDVLSELRDDPRFLSGLTAWRVFPETEGKYAEVPPGLHPSLKKALAAKGIASLYSHQRQCYDTACEGDSLCVVTPTASGKTMCYNLPVLDAVLKDPKTRALYIFPTKALAQDQLQELLDLSEGGGFPLKTFTYDGDTPPAKRKLAREVGQIIITNPDMLHQALLPHHTRWTDLFSSLKFVVIDEVHGYRGVFGSHVANVLRRLKRIAEFYGSKPQFLTASATIANPAQLSSSLTGEPVALVDESGAPSSEKIMVFWNPPLLTSDGVRYPLLDSAARIAGRFVSEGVQTIVFARSRVSVELLVQRLRDSYQERFQKDRIRGYRGGYLPKERRNIEKGLREGKILGVVSTNALELGIDIGNLDCAVLAGYPGTIASTWQQAGRSGRRSGKACSIMIPGPSPLDQFMGRNPDYFFSQSPEHALLNPDNPYIFGEHVKCAAYELPFKGEEPRFGGRDVGDILESLRKQNILYKAGRRWNWSSESYPAASVSLRSASAENFVVIDTTEGREVIGEVDWASAPLLIHDEAIYMHQGVQYHVSKLDYDAKKAYVKRVDVDYYTDANLATEVKIIKTDVEGEGISYEPAFGEVSVTAVATIFKKIKLYTNENLGSGRISLPEMTMHTQGTWFRLPEGTMDGRDPRETGALLSGLATLLLNVAPLFLMSDKRDLGVAVEARSPYDGKPTLYIYDSYPGGVGLAERVYGLLKELFKASFDLLSSCPCEDGCPGCVGPSGGVTEGTKGLCFSVLRKMVGEEKGNT